MAAQNPELWHGSVEKAQLIEKLLDIGVALSGSYNLGELLNLILSKSREITCSDAGSVYLVDKSDPRQPMLLFKAAQNASRPFVSLREFAIPLTEESLAGYVALTGESLNLPDAYHLPMDVPYRLNRNFDQDIGYYTKSVLVLPMRNRNGEAIGVLQLLNRKKSSELLLRPENVQEATQPYSEWEERVVRLLASQAGISIERNQLRESITNLFEGFVKSSVMAIETRDPWTSGHADRVSQLAVRLAQEVNAVAKGNLGSVNFTDRQLQELRYAALLHDFGEVAVPESILAKAQKLAPQQLDSIRDRFSLVRRTLEFESLQARYQLAISPSASADERMAEAKNLERELAEKIAQLEKSWQLIQQANGNSLSDEQIKQLERMARYTYRDVDNYLRPILTPDELESLKVRQGTLTPRERAVMESHVKRSYEFLQRIPWTHELEHLPEIIYTHHERLDGSGYPRGLEKDDIPISARILAIADTYDAVTSGARPHKDSLSTQAALLVLRQDADAHKLDADLVRLFEERRVFSVLGHRGE
ncbi:MAG TPA: HD domain-containing protein [Oscillatoriales cyanobacterium M59_W2019_021]|nr:HD domain-containing protein [Oscillatoriales cyanobacterium M4454_W2019_049]HIK51187.1 HD domain-containing protein [Oscillatoriales cyanobacterium M59_W2019_021]